MKKLLIILLTCLPLSVMAQQFGYMDYENILKQMPGYAEVQTHLNSLTNQYQAEMRRSEEEFNRKYNDFLDNQKSFADNIRIRRQKELQGLYEAGISFRKECEEELKKAEEELIAGVKTELNQAISVVSSQMNLEFVLNTHNNGLLFVGGNGIDITTPILTQLGIQ